MVRSFAVLLSVFLMIWGAGVERAVPLQILYPKQLYPQNGGDAPGEWYLNSTTPKGDLKTQFQTDAAASAELRRVPNCPFVEWSTMDTFDRIQDYWRVPIWHDDQDPEQQQIGAGLDVRSDPESPDVADPWLRLTTGSAINISYMLFDVSQFDPGCIYLAFDVNLPSESPPPAIGVMILVDPDSGMHYLLELTMNSAIGYGWHLYKCVSVPRPNDPNWQSECTRIGDMPFDTTDRTSIVEPGAGPFTIEVIAATNDQSQISLQASLYSTEPTESQSVGSEQYVWEIPITGPQQSSSDPVLIFPPLDGTTPEPDQPPLGEFGLAVMDDSSNVTYAHFDNLRLYSPTFEWADTSLTMLAYQKALLLLHTMLLSDAIDVERGRANCTLLATQLEVSQQLAYIWERWGTVDLYTLIDELGQERDRVCRGNATFTPEFGLLKDIICQFVHNTFENAQAYLHIEPYQDRWWSFCP